MIALTRRLILPYRKASQIRKQRTTCTGIGRKSSRFAHGIRGRTTREVTQPDSSMDTHHNRPPQSLRGRADARGKSVLLLSPARGCRKASVPGQRVGVRRSATPGTGLYGCIHHAAIPQQRGRPADHALPRIKPQERKNPLLPQTVTRGSPHGGVAAIAALEHVSGSHLMIRKSHRRTPLLL